VLRGDFAKLGAFAKSLQALALPQEQQALAQTMGNVALLATQQCFGTSTDPSGEAWKALKKRVGKPLYKEGHLRGSFTVSVRRGRISITSDHPGAATHQYGDRSRGIPARPMLPTGDEIPPAWDNLFRTLFERAMSARL